MSKPRRKSPWRKVLATAAYLAVCLAFLLVGTIFYAFGQSATLTQIVRQRLAHTRPQDVFDDKSAVTMLVLGCDQDRYYGGKQILKTAARSDMMLLVRFDFAKKKISAISIPRDLILEMPGFKRMRINAFHAAGKTPEEGREFSKRAVEYALNVSIDRVMELNFDKFQEVVDMVGGVDVFVDKHLKYTDVRGGLFIDIKPGRQHLDGYNSMCFVRYRHGDSDFNRQDRQKQLMLALKDKIIHEPGRLPAVTEKMREVLGSELSADEVAAMALFAQSIGNDNVKMGQVPVVELPRYELALDESKLDEVLTRFNFREPEKLGARG